MKNTTIVFCLLCVLAIFSCHDMNELHEKYTKNGEIIYTAKLDSLKVFTGNERLEINGYISGAFNVSEIVVSWKDSESGEMSERVFPYSVPEKYPDPVKLSIENIKDQSYQFKVFSRDSKGHESVRSDLFVRVYGSKYRALLESRIPIKLVLNTESSNDATFEFPQSPALAGKTEIKYTKKGESEQTTVLLANTEKQIVLKNLDPSKSLSYRTFYVPTPEGTKVIWVKDKNGVVQQKRDAYLDLFPSDWRYNDIIGIFNSFSVEKNASSDVIVKWKNEKRLKVKLSITNASNTQEIKSSDSDGQKNLGNISGSLSLTISDNYGNSVGKFEYNIP